MYRLVAGQECLTKSMLPSLDRPPQEGALRRCARVRRRRHRAAGRAHWRCAPGALASSPSTLIRIEGVALVHLDLGVVFAPAYMILYTSRMAKTVPVRELRANLSSLLDDVSDRRDHVLVTRNGAPAAALVPIDEYEALEETAEVLSDPEALSALEAGLAEIERGEVVTLSELRTELAERRPSAG